MTDRDTSVLREMIANHEQSLSEMKTMLDRIEHPVEATNPLFPRSVVARSADLPSPSAFQPPPVPQGPDAIQGGPPVTPGPLGNRGVAKSLTLESIKHWEEILFRPSMASAMLYVIMPVIEELLGARKKNAYELLPAAFEVPLQQLDVWGELTVAQRVVLGDLFAWVNAQVTAEYSVIPMEILSNISSATDAFDAAGPS